MRLRDRIRIEGAVQRVSWWLDWKRMPGPGRREVRRELRANLAEAARASELDEALDRLGEPRAMAEAYLADERSGVRWRAGYLAALLAYILVTWLLFAFTIGFAEGAQAVGPEVGQTYETGHGLVITDGPLTSFLETEEGLEFTLPFLTWLHVAAVVLAFAVFARPWSRLRERGHRRKRARRHQPV